MFKSFTNKDMLNCEEELYKILLNSDDPSILQLACRLPARVQGYPWRLAYSTVKHGTSLKTLYRNLAYLDSPVLLVIKDMDNQVYAVGSESAV